MPLLLQCVCKCMCACGGAMKREGVMSKDLFLYIFILLECDNLRSHMGRG